MTTNNKYDALVIGGGIAGQEAALNLADMDYKVLLVEKELSIGGKMIQLSKVFPTLDCAACITTPKMSETARHGNIKVMLNSTVKEIQKHNGAFTVKVNHGARYVKPEACTGCQQCEFACPEVRPDDYNTHLAGRKVAYIPFSLANPRIAAIDRNGTSAPCISACPGGVKPYGYVSLVRNGQYEEAMNLHLEDIPLPGSLGRACYAPCQGECTRGNLEGAVDIRRIKRFFAEQYYNKFPEPPTREINANTNKRVAIIGSGPAGLTAAYHLALKGHKVKIFEAAPKAGGMLMLTLPEYRLPKTVVERDIKNITSLGVEIECNKRVENITELKQQGFDAVFVAVGTHQSSKMHIEGENLEGVEGCLDFLRNVNIGERYNLTGKRVIVVGGGNTAIDASRTALRLGAEQVTVVYRRSREEMPCFAPEIKEAEEEGVKIDILCNPIRFIGQNGKVSKVELVRMKLGEPDASGRRSPIPIEGSNYLVNADLVIEAVGLQPSTQPFANELELAKGGTIKVNGKTFQTNIPYIFAGGDSVSGASTIIEAAGQGKKAAFYIDKYLNGLDIDTFEFDEKLPAADKNEVIAKRHPALKKPVNDTYRKPAERVKDFNDVEHTLTEQQAKESAERCLDCSNCRECHQCKTACPADAIDFGQKDELITVDAKTVIVSTGFKLFKPEHKPQYGYGIYPNVIDAMQMDRLIAPTRPFNNVLRPGDGKIPDKIAYILCTGSRDSSLENAMACSGECSNNPICSQICCMYSIKQAQLLMGALPMADITIYYMDIRAFGKGYDEFFQEAKSMGVNFVKGRIAKIFPKDQPNGDLILRYEDVTTGKLKESKHDLVVLSVGVLPNSSISRVFSNATLELDEQKFIKQIDELVNPAQTSIPGVFVAGTASGPKDIPDSILSAGTAAAEAASYINTLTH
ncbi:FAD-dependent oxidoreductase [Tenuifilum sp.]|uniref:FAD-dependent oxidoreductase n=1 Tax=Tenuifilum sp. TaxID=2760880 RepID=UPI001B775D1F|nr:FAD-dependent oxidoreductase [Bacteroidales bacterium]HOK60133.1 FAD-dependent oxidoreductase [Tenuifilum sp.]HOK85604.1 FAD-dependent oxidoreductase [Tenuifilum sp.]HON69622.1 FAD-dependent oxidoreductase [Tenuifilum sp.]HOU74488.1 FAD-dependent oxidoreductase [Tenuifilum sp.]